MERKVFQYIVLEEAETKELGLAVDELLQHGWELYGYPIINHSSRIDPRTFYCQAMILRENIKQEDYNRNEI